jgi:hypothetical protein
MEPLIVLLSLATLVGVIFIAVRQETNTTVINNAVSAVPKENDASEVVQNVNNLREAFKKTGKKQSIVVAQTGDKDEIVITVRPKTVKPVVVTE